MRNVATRTTTARTIFAAKGFMVGFNSVRRGLPLDYDRYTTRNAQWAYEQGRQFALQFSGEIKNSNGFTWDAKNAIMKLYRNNSM